MTRKPAAKATVETTDTENEALVAQAPVATESDDLMAVADAVREDDTDSPEHSDEDTVKAVRRSLPLWAVLTGFLAAAAILVAGTLILVQQDNESRAKVKQDVAEYLETQGAQVQALACNSDECTAVIDGSTYTVTILTDDHGKKQYGVSAYTR